MSATALVADHVRSITLERRDGGPFPAWSPGAHIDLTLGDGLVRQYSLCGDPEDRHRWTVIVLREPDSRGGSAYVHDSLAVGEALDARGPRNHFVLEDAPNYLFIAGGVGIAPILPMVSEAERRGVPWRLVYGGRHRSAMAHATDLAERYGDRVEVVPEDENGPLPVPALIERLGPDTALYCCGPEGLIHAVESAHAGNSVGTLHVERFRPRPQEPSPSSASFEVEAARSGKLVTVDQDTSILDALESVGVQVLSSCREGICGTCEVAVLDGLPEHRDSIMTEAERLSSESMFVCVSRCRSSRLVLDV